MVTKGSNFFQTLFLFFYKFLFRKIRNPKFQSNFSNNNILYPKYLKFHNSLAYKHDLSSKTIVFDVESALLKSTSLFHYFMLVAFEGGSFIRGLVLLLLYPLICLVNEDIGLQIMVLVSFFGVKEKSFRCGRSVLPKFFLEDVGLEVFEVLKKCKKKVGVSDLPQVMIENFLRDYLEIDFVVGRKMKVAYGFFLGVMEERSKNSGVFEKVIREEEVNSSLDVIGVSSINKSMGHDRLLTHCKEIYIVRRQEKRSWQILQKENYPNPLIFHDGRLALKPNPLATLALFIWIPFGLTLAIIRAIVSLTFPYKLSIPILVFIGLRVTITEFETQNSQLPKSRKGLLYVCNHRTLLDPLYLSFTLKKNFTAVTYSLSKLSEILSPIKTVRLTRNRDQDGKMMDSLLNQGDLVVCPEGTTCREPYLLRFSPLFTEMSNLIIPVALDSKVTMFHGTTASGLKCFDPLFFLLNPTPFYGIRVLNAVSGLSSSDCGNDKSTFEVANYVQREIGRVLGFKCTKLTRKDKYSILAGNDGSVNPSSQTSNS